MSFVFFLTLVELVKIRFWNVYQTLKIQRRRKLGRWFFNTPCSYNWKSHRVRVTHTDKTNRERKRRLWWLFWRHKIITYFVFYYNRTRLKTSEPLFYLNGLFERTPKAHHQKEESFYSKISALYKRILTRTRWETQAKRRVSFIFGSRREATMSTCSEDAERDASEGKRSDPAHNTSVTSWEDLIGTNKHWWSFFNQILAKNALIVYIGSLDEM